MTKIKGFNPIGDKDAKILILGSMPSDISLQKQEYYGYQHNTFWTIMSTLFIDNKKVIHDYSLRKKMLIENKIALWDVLQSCHREGSLDAAIKMDSIKINDFINFFSIYPDIKKVFFNGGKAETIFNKYVLPEINEQFGYLQFIRLPSTSPAHAAMTVKQKTDIWQKEINVN
jgi:hypoxanthine-DNA glycosylase